jgi:hypothetical protein
MSPETLAHSVNPSAQVKIDLALRYVDPAAHGSLISGIMEMFEQKIQQQDFLSTLVTPPLQQSSQR